MLRLPQYGPELLGSDVIQRASAEHLHGADRVCQRRKARCSTEAFLLEKSVQNAPESLPVGVIDGAYLGSLTKTCTVCKEDKALDLFGSWGKQRPGKLKAQCRACLAGRKREWHARNAERAHQSNREWLQQNRERRKAYRKNYRVEWYQQNRSAAKESNRAYYLANSAGIRARVKAYYDANPESVAARSREYYQLRADAIKGRVRRWAANNPGKCAEYRARRRSAQALSPWASQEAVAAVYRLAREMTRETGVRHAVDHIYPLKGRQVCGLHCEANLRVVTEAENSRKSAKLPGFLSSELWDPQGKGVFHG